MAVTDNATAKKAARKGVGLDPAVAGFKASTLALAPNATLNVAGAAQDLVADAGFDFLHVSDVKVVYGGTFGAETLTTTVTATFDDGTTASITDTKTATGTNDVLGDALDALTKSGHNVSKLTCSVASSINSSTATAVVTVRGLQTP